MSYSSFTCYLLLKTSLKSSKVLASFGFPILCNKDIQSIIVQVGKSDSGSFLLQIPSADVRIALSWDLFVGRKMPLVVASDQGTGYNSL